MICAFVAILIIIWPICNKSPNDGTLNNCYTSKIARMHYTIYHNLSYALGFLQKMTGSRLFLRDY